MVVGYFDCFSGVAGDMVLGALIDAGLPKSYLEKELRKLGLGSFYKLRIKSGKFDGLSGVNVNVDVKKEKAHRSYSDIVKIIEKSKLAKNVKKISVDIFSVLAKSEAQIHKKKIKDVHFHEVGSIDSIVDIVGSVIGIDYFGFEAVYSSPLPINRGYVKCAHGKLPLPAPATLELMKDIPVEESNIKEELVTPTGIAILKTVCKGFGSMPLRQIDKIGYGFGDKRIPGIANGLRLMVGEGLPLVAVEANIDDMNPEFYPDIIEKLLDGGALDAGVIPMVMKKGRPGAILHLLCEDRDRKKLVKLILKETTTFGVRYFPVEREMLEREIKKVKTKRGMVSVKIGKYENETVTISPEYSDCKKIADKKNIPIKDIYREAIIASREL